MSTRAIRNLRGDDAFLISQMGDDQHGDDDEDTDDSESISNVKSTFVSAMDFDDDDDDDDDDDETSESEQDETDDANVGASNKGDVEPVPGDSPDNQENATNVDPPKEENKEEDLEALLNEFQEKDGTTDLQSDETLPHACYFSILQEGLDVRDLDIDYSQAQAISSTSENRGRNKNRQKAPVFGPPRDGWKRPPHFVGGGIGMTSYDRDPRPLPWPYTNNSEIEIADGNALQDEDCDWLNQRRWFCFTHSETYQRDLDDFKHIQQSGDANALILFVAHHPYICEALLQSSRVMYQTNHSQEGLLLLRRCLWIFECSMLTGFARDSLNQGGTSSAFLDATVNENLPFFHALSKLIQVSNMAGLPQTALAVSRYTLSLDPLRDPMGVLLSLDHFALSTNSEINDRWLVNLVESDRIRIYYRDEDKPTTSSTSKSKCALIDLPNFAFSHALALFRLSTEYSSSSDHGETRAKANEALRKAIKRFPSVIGLLLQRNDIDTGGRSFRRDWVTVLDWASGEDTKFQNSMLDSGSMDSVDVIATLQATHLIIKIYVQQNGRLWGNEVVLNWVYDNMQDLQSGKESCAVDPLNPAIMRYLGSDPSDYEDTIQLLPPEANVIDPNLIAHAMLVDPNRRRFLRRPHRDARGPMDPGVGVDDDAWFRGVPRQVIGGPPTQVVDPDWPIVEVLWRSFLPWNRVDGVPPPRR